AKAVVRTVRIPAASWPTPDVCLPAGARSGGIAEISSAEVAKVAPFAANATQDGATASRIAPIAGPITTPRAWTVCRSAFAAPSRTSPTRRGRSAIVAAFSAQPAVDAEQHVRETPADRRRANPNRRVGCAVHVSDQRGVVHPITDLRCGAGPDQRPGPRESQDISI